MSPSAEKAIGCECTENVDRGQKEKMGAMRNISGTKKGRRLGDSNECGKVASRLIGLLLLRWSVAKARGIVMEQHAFDIA